MREALPIICAVLSVTGVGVLLFYFGRAVDRENDEVLGKRRASH